MDIATTPVGHSEVTGMDVVREQQTCGTRFRRLICYIGNRQRRVGQDGQSIEGSSGTNSSRNRVRPLLDDAGKVLA